MATATRLLWSMVDARPFGEQGDGDGIGIGDGMVMFNSVAVAVARWC